MILDIFKNRNVITLGKINRELRLRKKHDMLRWRWERVWFRKMRINTKYSLNPHMMITGESGTGKSNASKLILKQLADMEANFVVLDPHSEYVEAATDLKADVYDAGIHNVNIFDLDGMTERERTAEITALFRRVFHLGDVQAFTLYKCIAYTYRICFQREHVVNMHSLLFTIKVFKRHASKPEANILEGLEKRLLVVAGENFQKNVPMSKIMGSRSIFSLSSIHTAEAQSLYMESMLKKVYSSMLGRGSSTGNRQGKRKLFYIIIDEAEKIQNSTVIARLVAEGRKYGIGIIAISQRAKALDKEIRSNVATIIAFAQKEPEEQNYVANLIAGGTEYNRFIEVRKALRELGRGQALIQETREKKPKIIKCAKFEAKSRDPSHQIVKLAKGVVSKQELLKRLEKESFTEEEIINKVKKLIEIGVLKYYVVTEAPYQGTWYIANPRNSAEHDIMVNLISRYLTEIGVKNVIYNNSYGPDVIAYKDGKKIAIEYETGRKLLTDTERMLEQRKLKYQQVIKLGKYEINGV